MGKRQVGVAEAPGEGGNGRQLPRAPFGLRMACAVTCGQSRKEGGGRNVEGEGEALQGFEARSGGCRA
jgi:hypothetical protein